MPLTKFNGATNTIQLLSDQPNQTDGLTAAQLKMKFDQHAIDTEAYLNDTLTAELDANFAIKTEVVTDTGDQTIEGVKTFVSSPIVPSPTADMHASTKKFVVDTVGAAVISGLSPDSITDGYLKQSGDNVVPRLASHLADYSAYKEYIAFMDVRGLRRLI